MGSRSGIDKVVSVWGTWLANGRFVFGSRVCRSVFFMGIGGWAFGSIRGI